jgi:hypothetical protein
MADPDSRLSELSSLLMLIARIERAMEAARALPDVATERRASIAYALGQARGYAELAFNDHMRRAAPGEQES